MRCFKSNVHTALGLTILILAGYLGIYTTQQRANNLHLLQAKSLLIANPLPRPEFIASLQPEPGYNGSFDHPLCVSIWDGPPLVKHHASGSFLFENTSFSLDGMELQPSPHNQLNLLLLIGKPDEDDGITWFGGPIETCFCDVYLSKGSHIAGVHIKSMSAQIYDYNWAFIIE